MEASVRKDTEIVKDILSGNINCFSEIVDQYERLLNSIIYSMVNNVETTKDLTQEVFIKCYKKLSSYNTKYSFKYWLLQIARNHTIDHLRRKKTIVNIDEINPSAFSYTDGNKMEKQETSSKINEAMERLNEKDRTLLYLKYHEQYKNPEICGIMNISEKSIRVNLYRAKSKLRGIMSEMDYFTIQEVQNG
ncbi:sigma-70 family RNA polymerase sigma factor [candidate division WOR-3 bacterium]|nr:sigma-70 family RNA polymerase sigma factor [candidate division WOR-3 bacterium]